MLFECQPTYLNATSDIYNFDRQCASFYSSQLHYHILYFKYYSFIQIWTWFLAPQDDWGKEKKINSISNWKQNSKKSFQNIILWKVKSGLGSTTLLRKLGFYSTVASGSKVPSLLASTSTRKNGCQLFLLLGSNFLRVSKVCSFANNLVPP